MMVNFRNFLLIHDTHDIVPCKKWRAIMLKGVVDPNIQNLSVRAWDVQPLAITVRVTAKRKTTV